MSFKSIFRGWLGEFRGALSQWLFLDSTVYTAINNVTIVTANGSTQIDHVIVSRHGIFVVETKNMRGLILGDETSRQWTQVLPGKNYPFQNPLHQNYRHTKALVDLFLIEERKIIPIVVFWGNCQIKGRLPPNVITNGYTDFIKRHREVLFDDAEVRRIVTTIRLRMSPKTWVTRRQHLAQLKARFESTSICPKCGSPLRLRTARSGSNAGKQFYGCVQYPACRYTKDAGSGPGAS